MLNDENAVEQMVLDTLCGGMIWSRAAEELPRQCSNVLVESMVRDALIRLNPGSKAEHDGAGQAHCGLPTMLLSKHSECLVGTEFIVVGRS